MQCKITYFFSLRNCAWFVFTVVIVWFLYLPNKKTRARTKCASVCNSDLWRCLNNITFDIALSERYRDASLLFMNLGR